MTGYSPGVGVVAEYSPGLGFAGLPNLDPTLTVPPVQRIGLGKSGLERVKVVSN